MNDDLLKKQHKTLKHNSIKLKYVEELGEEGVNVARSVSNLTFFLHIVLAATLTDYPVLSYEVIS